MKFHVKIKEYFVCHGIIFIIFNLSHCLNLDSLTIFNLCVSDAGSGQNGPAHGSEPLSSLVPLLGREKTYARALNISLLSGLNQVSFAGQNGQSDLRLFGEFNYALPQHASRSVK